MKDVRREVVFQMEHSEARSDLASDRRIVDEAICVR